MPIYSHATENESLRHKFESLLALKISNQFQWFLFWDIPGSLDFRFRHVLETFANGKNNGGQKTAVCSKKGNLALTSFANNKIAKGIAKLKV